MAGALALAAWVLWPRSAQVYVPPAPSPPPPSLPPSPPPSPSPAALVPLRSVEGRVLDGAGQPVAGARVEALEEAPPRTAEPAGELGVLKGPIPFPPTEPALFGPNTLSGADGRFRLAGLRPGIVRLSASHPQFLRKTVEVSGATVDFLLEPAPPDAQLQPENGTDRLAGAVVDERGFPVPGARVEIAGHSAVSDGGGRFELSGLPAGPYRVRVVHADFAPLEVAALPGGDEARLQLLAGGGIEGELRDPRNGRQPPGTVLELVADGRSQPVTLRDGRFQVNGVRAGRVTLVARAPGYVPLRQELEVPPGERPRDVTVRDLRLELEKGGVVTGLVRAESGDPAAGVPVWAGATNGRTDSRGEFRIDGIPAGRVRVTAAEGGRRVAEEVEVRADEESRVELTLR